MRLFSKKDAEPLVPVMHPPVRRVIYVRADVAAVARRLAQYSTLFAAKRSDDHTVRVASSSGWSAIRLPDEVHPWQLHNLAFWMLDCDGADGEVIAWSGAGPGHPGYWLIRDPELPDAMCGWDYDGHGWTVIVPTNDVVRPDDVPVARSISSPSGFGPWFDIEVRLEDPGADMNPANAATLPSRTAVANQFDTYSWAP
jgi:hypothetical protein